VLSLSLSLFTLTPKKRKHYTRSQHVVSIFFLSLKPALLFVGVNPHSGMSWTQVQPINTMLVESGDRDFGAAAAAAAARACRVHAQGVALLLRAGVRERDGFARVVIFFLRSCTARPPEYV